jgi:hypothetical protein
MSDGVSYDLKGPPWGWQDVFADAARQMRSLDGRVEITEVTSGVTSLVAATSIDRCEDIPSMFRKPGVVMPKRDGDALFGDYDGICWVIGRIHGRGPSVIVCSHRLGGGGFTFEWHPRFALDEVTTEFVGADHDEREMVSARRNCVRFLNGLSAMIEADLSPISEKSSDCNKGRRGPRGIGSGRGAVTVRRLYVGASSPRGTSDKGPAPDPVLHSAASGLVVDTLVRGHLKRQPHGEGGKLRKWVYVAPYHAARICSPKDRLTIVAVPRGE